MSSLPRPTRRGLALATAGIAAAVAGMSSGFTDVTRGGVFALTLVLLALALTLVRPGRMSLVRSTGSDRLRAGHEHHIRIDITVRRPYLLPGWLIEQQTFTGETGPRWRIQHVTGAFTVGYSVKPPHRGRFEAGPAVVAASDPLGLAVARREQGSRSTWLVWPTIHPLSITPKLAVGTGDDALVSAHATHSGLPGASIREYAQGDDMRIVHWPATAHRGELMVRQFDPPAEPMTRLVVHGRIAATGQDAAWEWLLSAAASACVHFGEIAVPISASIGPRHTETVRETLDALAEATDCPVAEHELASAPTVLFHHTSAGPPPGAPRNQRSIAFVAGPQASSHLRHFEALGWLPVAVPDDAPVAEFLAGHLRNFGGR